MKMSIDIDLDKDEEIPDLSSILCSDELEIKIGDWLSNLKIQSVSHNLHKFGSTSIYLELSK